MSSNQKPSRLHVAIFPSIITLNRTGAGKHKVTKIRAHFSKALHRDLQKLEGSIFKQILTEFRKIAIVDWNVETTGQALTLEQIADEIKRNNIPDMVLDNITFTVPYLRYNGNTFKNETFHTEWTFKPYTFRKGVWNRLKAINFPAKKLYEEYVRIKRDLTENLSKVTRKRWRDTILMNQPHDELTNQEIRSIWQGEPFVLILKESRGRFDLMDMGEWR